MLSLCLLEPLDRLPVTGPVPPIYTADDQLENDRVTYCTKCGECRCSRRLCDSHSQWNTLMRERHGGSRSVLTCLDRISVNLDCSNICTGRLVRVVIDCVRLTRSRAWQGDSFRLSILVHNSFLRPDRRTIFTKSDSGVISRLARGG